MIKAEHLSKSYGKKTVVSDVSFEVAAGKITGFLGPNGAGKSTTMRLMLGLDYGGGKTTFDGKPLGAHPRPMSVVGILLEAKAFHPTRSARHHLKALAISGNMPSSRVDEALDIVGLKSQARKSPGKFSLGMAQRLGIAAAILGAPKYLLLDEPSNGLDPEGMAWLREFLIDYANKGNAVFVSSHLLNEVSQIADNVIVIGKGKLLANASVDEFVSGNAAPSVFVRVANIPELMAVLTHKNIAYTETEGGLDVFGIHADDIGKLALDAGIAIIELTSHAASLEKAYLALTSSTEEFRAKGKVK